jgi:hypothetical protein
MKPHAVIEYPQVLVVDTRAEEKQLRALLGDHLSRPRSQDEAYRDLIALLRVASNYALVLGVDHSRFLHLACGTFDERK